MLPQIQMILMSHDLNQNKSNICRKHSIRPIVKILESFENDLKREFSGFQPTPPPDSFNQTATMEITSDSLTINEEINSPEISVNINKEIKKFMMIE